MCYVLVDVGVELLGLVQGALVFASVQTEFHILLLTFHVECVKLYSTSLVEGWLFAWPRGLVLEYRVEVTAEIELYMWWHSYHGILKLMVVFGQDVAIVRGYSGTEEEVEWCVLE